MNRATQMLMLNWLLMLTFAAIGGCRDSTQDRNQEVRTTNERAVGDKSPGPIAEDRTKSSQRGSELRIAAASDLKFALDELAEAFHKAHPGIEVKVTFGSSGNLFAQISNEAPFDLFLAADIQYARDLAEQGKGWKETLFPYALGHIVVWVPTQSDLNLEELGIQSLVDARVKKVAIANPKHAPYGRVAEIALKNLGVYEQVSRRLVLGENIAQASQFVESGAADIGVIAQSLALAPAMQSKGRYWPIPIDAYPPLVQGGIILNRCQDREAAEQFQAYLIGEEGRSTLQRYGFGLPNQ